MTATEAQEFLTQFLEEWDDDKGRFRKNVAVHIRSAITNLKYILRDEEIESKQGKEYFEAKDGVKPETVVKAEIKAETKQQPKKTVAKPKNTKKKVEKPAKK